MGTFRLSTQQTLVTSSRTSDDELAHAALVTQRVRRQSTSLLHDSM